MALFPEIWNARHYSLIPVRRRKQTDLLQLGRTSLTLKGLAPKFSKRTILTGPGSFVVGFLFFHTFFSNVVN